MERAGDAAAALAAAMLGASGGRVVVLAGPGNNGGDAYVCARRLLERGCDVEIVEAAEAKVRPGDAANARTTLAPFAARLRTTLPQDSPALVVDGLFGVGLSRPLGEPYAAWVEWANATGAPVLALDVPSGLDAATGVAHAPTIRASATATFIALKPGLLTCDGPDHCGDISVHALGVEAELPAT